MRLEVDGKEVYAATGGKPFDPDLPTVVFLHGAAMDHTVWALQTRYFAHHGRAVLAVDLPGHGRSAGPPLADIGGLAEWTTRLLDAAGVARAAIVGHSMGALVALETAARHPDRTWALALLGVALPMPVNDAFLALAEANDHRAVELMMDWGHGRRAHVGGHRVPGLSIVGGDMRLVERAAPGVMHADLAACNAYRRGDEAVANVRCPMLLVLGEDDRMTPPAAGRKIADKCDTAEVAVLAGCGHMMMVETPDAVLDALREVV